MLHAVNCVLKIRNRMLKCTPTSEQDKWKFKYMCASNCAGDKNNRLSITGYCTYVNRCLISWKSLAQKQQILFSTEAEYVA